uniref:Outer membrane protein beta-barrel domain-containing protein n=1 Tax=uncultured marine microorganism TaxID=415540 RepID=A5CFX8_9ZZZZ|nr:hypothetical protein [uncultured marine microorganism]
MKTFLTRTVVLTTALLLGGNAMADDNLWFGVKAGTLGIGLEASWRALPWFDLGVGANLYDYEDTGSQAGINYDATLALDTFYATASFRFPLSPFRMTVGAYSNGNEVLLVSQPMGIYPIGDDFYTQEQAGTLRSSSTFEDFAPYLGAGFDFELVGRLGISFDFGVLWQGDPIVTLTSDGPLANDPEFRLALELERQQLESEVEDLKAYPVVSIGFHFNF